MRLPWAAGERLRPNDWKSVRVQLMFDCCKWDIQSEDHSVVTDYPLFLEEHDWKSVASLAEKLSQEVLAAEQELLSRPIYTQNSVCREEFRRYSESVHQKLFHLDWRGSCVLISTLHLRVGVFQR